MSKIVEIKRKKGAVYQTVVDMGRDSSGKRLQVRVTARTKRDLQAKIDNLRGKKERGEIVSHSAETIASLANVWLKTCEHSVAHRTYDSYRDVVETYIIPYLGNIKLKKLTATHIEDAKTKWLALPRRDNRRVNTERKRKVPRDAPVAKISPASVSYYLRILRMVLNYAVDNDKLAVNVAKRVKLPRTEEFKSQTLDEAKFGELLEFARNWSGGIMWVPIILAATTGLRRGELCGLTWADVDFEQGVLHVRRSIDVRRDGLGLRPKDPKGRRVAGVVIPGILTDVLRVQRANQERRLSSVTPDTPVLDDQGGWMHPDTLGKAYFRCRRAAKFPEIRLHDLRHCYLTWLANIGASTRVLQTAGRHSSISMVEHYTRSMDPAYQAAIAALDEKLRGAIKLVNEEPEGQM